MMKKIFILFLAIIFFNPTSVEAKKVKSLSQLERREVETHFFETADTSVVMKAAINTLQDSGFIIQEIEPELGYLRARKVFKKRYVSKGRAIGYSLLTAAYTTLAVFTYGSTAFNVADPAIRLGNEFKDKTVVVDSNVNVERFGKNRTRVRFVLVQKVLQNADGYSFVKSAPTRVMRIYDPKIYQEFFAQLDKSIFYEEI